MEYLIAASAKAIGQLLHSDSCPAPTTRRERSLKMEERFS
jgi:hypothetical protein